MHFYRRTGSRVYDEFGSDDLALGDNDDEAGFGDSNEGGHSDGNESEFGDGDESELGDSDEDGLGDGDVGGLGDGDEDGLGDGDEGGLGDGDEDGLGDGNEGGLGDGIESGSDDNSYDDDSGESECDTTDDDELVADSNMFQPIYPGSDVTVAGAYCAIMEFKRICRLPFTTIVVLLQLLQLFCPAGNKLPTSKHQLKKFFQRYTTSYTRRNFCRSCNTEITGRSLLCSNRNCPRREPNSMIYLSPDRSLKRIISGN